MMLEELQRRNYSAITTRNYLRVVSDFAKHFGKSPDKLGPNELRTYQAYLLTECKLTPGTVVNRVAALRFFFVKTLKRHQFREFLPYPRDRRRLPTVLSREEVARLIDAAAIDPSLPTLPDLQTRECEREIETVARGCFHISQDPKQRQLDLESNQLLVTEVHCKHWPLPLASSGEQDHGGNARTPQEKRRKTNSHHRTDSHPDRQTPEQSDCTKHTCRIVGTRQPKVPLHDACKGHQPEQARSGYPFVSSIGSWLHCPGA
jgi:hypothetical protein